MFGRYGKFIFLFPLAGLIVSQSVSPYILFVLLCAGYFALKKHSWALYAFPLIGVLWVGMVLANMQPGFSFASDLSTVNANRAQSFGYRLQAFQDHVPVIWEKPILGFGGFGRGRIENVAVDSQVLSMLLARGILGALTFYVWWMYALFAALSIHKVVPNSILSKRARGIAVMISWGMLISAVDKALSPWLLLLAGGVVGTYMWLINHQSSDELEPSLNQMMAHSRRDQLSQPIDTSS